MSSENRTPLIRTLRARLTALHLATLAATLGVFALMAYVVLSVTLAHHHDDELQHQADDLVRELAGAPLAEANIQRAFIRSGVGSRLVMLRDDRGQLLYRDPILAETEPSLGEHQALVHAAAAGSTSAEFFTVELERSGEVRFVCAPIPGSAAYVQIGDPIGDLRATQHAIALASLPLIPLVLVLSSLGGWMLANRALAPMQTVTTTLEDIQATSLARRIDVHVKDQEISALVSTINHLLDRLQRAFESMRQFAGDVSHQLQTPLTVLRGSAEAALASTSPDVIRERLRDVVGEIDDMRVAIANLRTFALAEAPVHAPSRVDMSALVEETAEVVAALGELHGVHVTSDVAGGVLALGDAVRLKQVILNLGDNAVKYTETGGHVSVRLRATDQDAILEVSDTGIGIAPEHLGRLFDRLYRAPGPHAGVTGSGLGLAIVKRIVEAHGGTVHVDSSPGRGSTFAVRLPRA